MSPSPGGAKVERSSSTAAFGAVHQNGIPRMCVCVDCVHPRSLARVRPCPRPFRVRGCACDACNEKKNIVLRRKTSVHLIICITHKSITSNINSCFHVSMLFFFGIIPFPRNEGCEAHWSPRSCCSLGRVATRRSCEDARHRDEHGGQECRFWRPLIVTRPCAHRHPHRHPCHQEAVAAARTGGRSLQ